MKRIFFITIIAISMLFVSSAQAQIFRLGVKAGANFSKFKLGSNISETYKNNSATGYEFGLMARIKVPIIGLAIHPELLYSYVGNDDNKIGYFQVPVNLQWGVDLKVVRPYLQAGPYWGYAVSKSGDFKLSDINRSDWGIGLGAGIEFLNHLQLAFKYNWGLTDLNDTSNSVSFKNRVFNISLGYLF